MSPLRTKNLAWTGCDASTETMDDLLDHHAAHYTRGNFQRTRFLTIVGGRAMRKEEVCEAVVDEFASAEAFIASVSKSLQVIIAHAHTLDAIDINLEGITDRSIRDIYTQAYTASQFKSENCKITCTSLGGVRQNPRIRNILLMHASAITKGRLVYETIALSKYTPEEIDLFLEARHNLRAVTILSPISEVPDLVASSSSSSNSSNATPSTYPLAGDGA
ncbi:hypothetical protein C8F04DRAFT_1249920 [Mycena alexandri]|uniref:Uncharacterized protein n=1 Tax=Mycena alexandri TaxID=1745969 RepID=A0AAD6TEC4_9AGAR|nr:hypothetical protein C8F04DRAFT_1249920 [Mycena alexandri]